MLPEFSLAFHPVLVLPGGYDVLDFTVPRRSDTWPQSTSLFTVGRYNEKRQGVYHHALFGGKRDNHIGIDLGAPAGTAVHAFYEGEIYLFADNERPGDYGPTLITRHLLNGVEMYALYGHLSRASLQHKRRGQEIAYGETLGWLGGEHENGGWPPHVHFQLSLVAPDEADMPGTVSDEDLETALKIYPDPRVVLGPIY
ncbi:MAG: peptidoglycan DD-metalloendopeptidase family protein [Chitinophagaceae bacterium]|nr:peptidoglycan DD-metalloendopeptidase family protein [Oligoflexus sp.]